MNPYDNAWNKHLTQESAKEQQRKEAAAQQRAKQETENLQRQQRIGGVAQKVLNAFQSNGQTGICLSRNEVALNFQCPDGTQPYTMSADQRELQRQLNSELNQHGYEASVGEIGGGGRASEYNSSSPHVTIKKSNNTAEENGGTNPWR